MTKTITSIDKNIAYFGIYRIYIIVIYILNRLCFMETRKVQVTGKSTYVVSLPKKWVNKVNVKNGDSITLFPLSNGTLLINPKINETVQSLTKEVLLIDQHGEDQLFRMFVGAYLAGYDIIEFRSRDEMAIPMKQCIRKLSQRVIGVQVIEETKNAIVLKDMLDSSDYSMSKGVRRMQIITRDMHMEAIRSLTESNPAIADDVVARDDEVDKLFWMIEKQHHQVLRDVYFAEKLNVTPQEALGFLLVARSIERVADHAVKLANNGRSVRPNHPLVPKLTEMSKAVIDLFDDATNTFNKNNFDNAYDIINRSELLGIKIEKLKHDTLLLVDEQSTTVAIAYIIESLDRTRLYSEDIAETAINHHFAQNYSLEINRTLFQEEESRNMERKNSR